MERQNTSQEGKEIQLRWNSELFEYIPSEPIDKLAKAFIFEAWGLLGNKLMQKIF